MVADYNKRKGEKLTGELCAVCATPLYSDPGPQELGIYLHALAYEDVAGEWAYRTQMPSWGMPTSGAEDPTAVEPWDYSGAGGEGLEGFLEREMEERTERERNARGMWRNKAESG